MRDRSAYYKTWYEANREKRLIKNREYWHANAEALRLASKMNITVEAARLIIKKLDERKRTHDAHPICIKSDLGVTQELKDCDMLPLQVKADGH